jgi:hypothetical protein
MKADQIEDFSDILADIDTKLLPIVDPVLGLSAGKIHKKVTIPSRL